MVASPYTPSKAAQRQWCRGTHGVDWHVLERKSRLRDAREWLLAHPPHNDDECTVCLAADGVMAAVPCGHRCACKTCSATLAQLHQPCPLCRSSVTTWIQVF